MNLLFDARFEMVQWLRRPAEDNQATATRYLEYWLRRVGQAAVAIPKLLERRPRIESVMLERLTTRAQGGRDRI